MLCVKTCVKRNSYNSGSDYIPLYYIMSMLQLAVSSDKISSVQDPLVDVTLDLVEGEDNKTLSVEMNSDELKQLIQSLEAANKVCSN